MKPHYLGDSYDIVKRYFCEALRLLGYSVYADLLPTGNWNGAEQLLYRFIGARPHTEAPEAPSALFLDPDTGVARKAGSKHVSFERVAVECASYEIVFAFDQSCSRGSAARPQIDSKLRALAELSCVGMYYDSHARFLFASRNSAPLERFAHLLIAQGLPGSRLVTTPGMP
jgi:hypothetical protein